MEGNKLYIGNLSDTVTKEHLEGLFANQGKVKQVSMIGGRGLAVVEMSEPAEAERARKVLDGFEFEGQNLIIDKSPLH